MLEDELGIFRKEGSGMEWYYTEFEDKRGTWDRSRRMIFTGVRSDGELTYRHIKDFAGEQQ